MSRIQSRNATRATSARTSHETSSTNGFAPEQIQEQVRQQVDDWSTSTASLLRTGQLAFNMQLSAMQRSGRRLQEFSARVVHSRTPFDFAAAHLQMLVGGAFDTLQMTKDVANAWGQLSRTSVRRQARSGPENIDALAAWLRAWQQMWMQTQQAATAGAQSAAERVASAASGS